ncbi:4-hydroxy-3-methylbut-2-enyl diphosphate reductase [Pirellulimonas nuda]|uniref:4-hydroxy-3-methylbut-2-enyl diphosphate reductase n=2 Tax=Pirellulimonas nuda TaxID=2528009 RepID=A0A518D9I4_9BACT|nr:4-hydroxy-3-methylbut-2-enyl diphosphate reductase [Pirellulimonas nuda]
MAMKVILASPRGFCAGVNMAIDSLELALAEFGAPIYVYHEIVHNQYVVNHFRDRGVKFVNELDEAPEGATLLFSAHGVSPEVRRGARERRLHAIDATCPLVTKVHLEAIKYAKQGYTIFLIGHEGHDEVIGTMGEAPEAIVLVETPDQVDSLEVADESKLAYLTQTTLSVDDANRIIDRLRERFPGIHSPPKADICYATQNRQEAVALLSTEADLVLVLGSQNSSNSQRLAELARERGIDAHLIDGPQEIDVSWFNGVQTVLVTAGASAPETVVESCLDLLRDRFDATVEPRVIRKEEVTFPLPRELRSVAAARSESLVAGEPSA